MTAPVVTLVHGTFGRLPGTDAAWTREPSVLRRTLRAELGDDVVFTTFRWSGMNWPSARYAAAAGLRAHLRDVAATHPDRRRYVVAHSHGGNVALYALRDIECDATEPSVGGVVCLSTPFIAAQPRAVTAFRFVSTYAVLLVTFFALVANAMGIVVTPWIATLDPSDALLQAILLNEIWLEFGLCAFLAWHATNALVRLARHRRDRIAVGRIQTPIRICRSVGDEASALLATTGFFSWLVTLAWALASVLTVGVAALFAALLLAPLLVPAAVLLLLDRLITANRLRATLTRLARSRAFGVTLVTLGILAALGTWGYLLAGTPFGTAERWYGGVVAGLVVAVLTFGTLSGLGYGLTAPFLEVTAETTPAGSWQIHLFEGRHWNFDDVDAAVTPKPGFLVHSAAYTDEGVIRAIAHWIRDRETRPSVGS